MKELRRMSLRAKITLLVSLNIFLMLILMATAMGYLVVEGTFRASGERALAVARTVAVLPEIEAAFREDVPSRTIEPLAESIRRKTGAEFIVVGNMQLIRYSHPNPHEIGRHMVGEDNDAVVHGRESITRARGTLGYSVRGKAPIFDREHRQVGVVSVGFLVKNVWGTVRVALLQVATIAAVALLFGLGGSYLLSGHIREEIMGMEPGEIAFVNREQKAILQAIREAIVAVNGKGRIVTCNREAQKLLGREEGELLGRDIREVHPESRLPEVLATGLPQYDQQAIVGNTLVLVNRIPVISAGEVIGAVSTFRDKMELDQLDRRLADIGHYLDTLRSQRHEFMNKLHLISGLMHVADYQTATAVIGQVNEEYQGALEFYLARVRDPAIVGILAGKSHRAAELGIKLTVTPETFVGESCPHRDLVITLLGNTVENAFEALQGAGSGGRHPEVELSLREEEGRLVIEVEDNGPGVDPAIGERLFQEGVSTKGEGRGFGMSLVARLVQGSGGTITCDSSGSGTLVRVELPVGSAR